jgi:hypothetical protein
MQSLTLQTISDIIFEICCIQLKMKSSVKFISGMWIWRMERGATHGYFLLFWVRDKEYI